MAKLKFVKLTLCELTLYEHLAEWLRQSGIQQLYLCWITKFPKLAMLVLRGCIYIIYFEIWENNKQIYACLLIRECRIGLNHNISLKKKTIFFNYFLGSLKKYIVKS